MAKFKRIGPLLKVSDMKCAVGFSTRVVGFMVCWYAANHGCGEKVVVPSWIWMKLGVQAALSSTTWQPMMKMLTAIPPIPPSGVLHVAG
jgi:hypothetical protein